MPKTSAPIRKTNERLFLLDGMALAYRAYFSFISRPLMNSKGENTSAIFGFVNTLMKILNDEKPEHIAVVFDTKQPTFRHIMYEAYKATRQKMPEELAGQLDKLKEVVQAFNVPTIEVPGYEADDIMGTLARRAEQEGIETFLVTGDKDFMQLISPTVKMYRPGKHGDEWEILDAEAVKDKFGVSPEHVIDVLALIGDKSDNVPGVFGIGEKTAIPLIQRFGSVEHLFENLDKIEQKGTQQKLKQYHDNALLSKKLVTIDVNVPLDVDLHHLSSKPKDVVKLKTLFTELEFKSLARKISEEVRQTSNAADTIEFNTSKLELTDITTDTHTYHLITTEKELKSLIAKLKKAKIISFDTETSGVDPLKAELIGLSLAIEPGEAWYVAVKEAGAMSNEQQKKIITTETVPTGDLFAIAKPQTKIRRSSHYSHQEGLPIELALKHLSPVLENPSIKKVGQNAKFDMLVLASHGVRVEGVAYDTMVANYVLRPDGQHNLDALASEHLNYKMVSYEELTGKGKDQKPLREIEVAKIADYAAQDADITLRLYNALKFKLEEQKLLALCEDIEFPLISVLMDMEFTGVSLDLDYLHDLSKEMERLLDTLIKDIYNHCGEQFNINSTQQLSKILFEKLKLTTFRKTKTGFSTDVGVLEELRNEHPVIERLLEYRQLQKLKSTYVDALPELINPKTGRVHTSFNQTVAATGRLSSSNPNFQNIPIRTEIGRSIRKAFIPADPKHLIMSADYSQIELRIMAHISGDEGMTEAFRNGEDIHTTTAAKVFGIAAKDVTRDMRRKSKEVNFGIMYGIGPYGLATRLNIAQAEAKEIITKYFERFPKVGQYMSDTLAKTRRDGYACTLLGRRRFFPDINSKNFSVRGNAQRQAINMPIQGTAADMIKLAMINIHSGLLDKKIEAKMILQVHDELVFEIAKDAEKRAKNLVAEKMKTALPLSVPIEVEIGVGKNWLEAH